MKIERKGFPSGKWIKYLPYPLLGLLIFYVNSQLDFNYFVKGYLSLLELQVAIVLVYYITSKLRKVEYFKSTFKK